MPGPEALEVSIREHLAEMEDVRYIDEPVDPDLGVTPYLREDQTRPVMFENAAGSRLVGNLWSTRDRIAAALNTDRENLVHRIAEAPCMERSRILPHELLFVRCDLKAGHNLVRVCLSGK